MQNYLINGVISCAIAAAIFSLTMWVLPTLILFFANLLPKPAGRRLPREAGIVLLSRSYAGYRSGTVVQLSDQEEDAIVAQGIGTRHPGPVTAGPVTTINSFGRVAIAAGQSSVTITNRKITSECKVWACVAQPTADATLLRVERVVCGEGLITIYGTAAATATVSVDWAILNTSS